MYCMILVNQFEEKYYGVLIWYVYCATKYLWFILEFQVHIRIYSYNYFIHCHHTILTSRGLQSETSIFKFNLAISRIVALKCFGDVRLIQ